jgi:putative membrane protein
MQRIARILGLAVATAFPGCTQMGPGWMGGGPGTMHPWFGGGYFMWILLIILAAVVIYLISQQRKGSGPSSPAETPMDILKKRYAAGEITKEQFEDMKKDLQ